MTVVVVVVSVLAEVAFARYLLEELESLDEIPVILVDIAVKMRQHSVLIVEQTLSVVAAELVMDVVVVADGVFVPAAQTVALTYFEPLQKAPIPS